MHHRQYLIFPRKNKSRIRNTLSGTLKIPKRQGVCAGSIAVTTYHNPQICFEPERKPVCPAFPLNILLSHFTHIMSRTLEHPAFMRYPGEQAVANPDVTGRMRMASIIRVSCCLTCQPVLTEKGA
jgi:hypothetical protein